MLLIALLHSAVHHPELCFYLKVAHWPVVAFPMPPSDYTELQVVLFRSALGWHSAAVAKLQEPVMVTLLLEAFAAGSISVAALQ